MTYNTLNWIIISMVIGCSWSTTAQKIDGFPEIGKEIPDFQLHNIHRYPEKNIEYLQLEGKPVILYFWSMFCSGAVKSLKNINDLHAKFEGDLEIFVIGGEPKKAKDNYLLPGQELGMNKLKELYDRLGERLQFMAPNAFDDELYQKFVPRGVPNVVWINRQGIVMAVTSTINEDNINSFLRGESFAFKDRSHKANIASQKNSYDRKKPFLTEGNGGPGYDFLYRSLLSTYKTGVPGIPYAINEVCKENDPYIKGRLEGYAHLLNLYKLAYLGYIALIGDENNNPQYKNDYNKPILEMENKDPFLSYDFLTGKDIYVYSLSVPPKMATPERMMKIMQNDLTNYFGYNARIENRILPYWSIGITEKGKEKLLSKGGKHLNMGDGFTLIGYQNIAMQDFLDSIFYLADSDEELPTLNETNFEGHIDIPPTSLIWQDFDAIKEFLKSLGFTIKKKSKSFRVLVIS